MHLTTNLQFLNDRYQEVSWENLVTGWSDYLTDASTLSAVDLHQISSRTSYSMERLITEDLHTLETARKAEKPGIILLDADGTLTDGGMYYTEKGDQIKRFNVKDGMIIHRLIRRQGVRFGLISSGSAGHILKTRAETIGIQHLYFGTRKKVDVIEEWLEELNLTWNQVAYVGDDLNDLDVILKAGYTACPSDAVRRVREASQHVLRKAGGQGCIREYLEDILGYEV